MEGRCDFSQIRRFLDHDSSMKKYYEKSVSQPSSPHLSTLITSDWNGQYFNLPLTLLDPFSYYVRPHNIP